MLLQILPTTTWIMHQRQFLQREGEGARSLKQPLGSEHAKSCPEAAFRFSSRGPFLRLCSQSYFQRIPVKTLHFPPGFSLGPDRRRSQGWKAGCRRHWHRAPEQRLLGRPSPLHVGGRSWAEPRRAGQRARSPPHPHRGRRAGGSRRPRRGGCFSEFKGHKRQQLRRRRRGRLWQLLLPLLHTPGLRASFLSEEGGGRGAGGGVASAAEETRGCGSPAPNHSLPLPSSPPPPSLSSRARALGSVRLLQSRRTQAEARGRVHPQDKLYQQHPHEHQSR